MSLRGLVRIFLTRRRIAYFGVAFSCRLMTVSPKTQPEILRGREEILIGRYQGGTEDSSGQTKKCVLQSLPWALTAQGVGCLQIASSWILICGDVYANSLQRPLWNDH